MNGKRIGWLDLWRSALVVLMLAYHFLYDLAIFGRVNIDLFDAPLFVAVRLFVCSSFILIAGVSCRFSRNNSRRGIVVFGAGLVVSLASAAVGLPVYFGILQLLGVSILLYGLLGRYLLRVPGWLAAGILLALFLISFPCADGVETGLGWLWAFGFVPEGFFSADYYPVFPWLFLFLLGVLAGGPLSRAKSPRLYAHIPSALTWPGRHSLIIYLLHQPLLYGVCWLFLR